MFDVVVDELALRVGDSLLHGMQLLGQFDATAFFSNMARIECR